MESTRSVFDLRTWRFDRPTGVWRCDIANNALLRHISYLTGTHVVHYTGPLTLSKHQRLEFGRAYPKESNPTLKQFAQLAASWMAPGRLWIEAPHFRRSDDSVLECSCGAKISPADRDFGRGVDLHRGRCQRVAVHKQAPGNTIAIYGIAAEVGSVTHRLREPHADEISEGAGF
jgi:hypothetical protein